MTRDEAIEKFGNAIRSCNRGSDGEWIDAFVALGMLKLEEPKSAHQRMVDACKALKLSPITIDTFAYALKNCGLVVVEK